jgi:outer membrane protein assembly factor BamB
MLLSIIAGMLCLVGMVAGFIANGLSHTHAAEGLHTNTTQRNTTKSAQSSVRPEVVIQGNIYYGSRRASVYALNALTGALIWKYSAASSLVTVTNGIAYVTSSSGTLVALKGTNGRVLWQYQGSLVTVTNGIAYVTSSPDTLVALKAFTGSLLWSYQIRSHFLWSPLIVNTSVYLGANDGLYTLEASHGSLLWHYQTSQGYGLPTSPPPVFVHDTVYYVTYGGTYPTWYALVSALKATDGSLLWSYKVDGTDAGVGATVSFVKGKVLVRGYEAYYLQQIAFLDPAKGSVIYSHRLDVEFHDFFLIDGVIYLTDYTHVYAIRLSDGTVLWSYQPGGGSDRIEVVDQIVYVFEGIYETGPVTAHKATDGTLLWSMQPAPYASVTGSNNIVYIFEGGTTTARKATDGTMLWSYQSGICGVLEGIINGIIYFDVCLLYALNARNGSLLWGSGITGLIARMSNGFLYVKNPFTGILYVLNASNGTQVWSSGKAASISTVVKQIVYVVSSRGTVYALDATNGTQLWSY